jgi:hypothetical protein
MIVKYTVGAQDGLCNWFEWEGQEMYMEFWWKTSLRMVTRKTKKEVG